MELEPNGCVNRSGESFLLDRRLIRLYFIRGLPIWKNGRSGPKKGAPNKVLSETKIGVKSASQGERKAIVYKLELCLGRTLRVIDK